MAADTGLWDSFDFKAVSLYSGNYGRGASVFSEFNRVGLSGVLPFWSAPSPYVDVVASRVSRVSRFIACTLKHQQMVRMAYDTGSSFGLFMEDDILFLSDTHQVESALGQLPQDADVLLFDWLVPDTVADASIPSGTDCWLAVRACDLRAAGCYALSRKGMAAYLDRIETPGWTTSRLALSDMYWGDLSADRNIRLFCSKQHLAAQCDPVCHTPFNATWRRYARSGASRASYPLYTKGA